jgi:hypothetical protein
MNLLRDDLLTFLSDYDRNVAHLFPFHTCVTFERYCLIFFYYIVFRSQQAPDCLAFVIFLFCKCIR